MKINAGIYVFYQCRVSTQQFANKTTNAQLRLYRTCKSMLLEYTEDFDSSVNWIMSAYGSHKQVLVYSNRISENPRTDRKIKPVNFFSFLFFFFFFFLLSIARMLFLLLCTFQLLLSYTTGISN